MVGIELGCETSHLMAETLDALQFLEVEGTWSTRVPFMPRGVAANGNKLLLDQGSVSNGELHDKPLISGHEQRVK
jgi:hypothetical protein